MSNLTDPRRGGVFDARQHPDADVEPDPHVARQARQVDHGANPRHAAATAAARSARAGRGNRGRRDGIAAAADGSPPQEPDAVPRVTSRWTRSALAWRTSTPSAAGGTRTASSPSTRPGRCRAVFRSTAPARCGKSSPRPSSKRSRRCLAEKLLTYAIGRGVEFYDKCALDDIARHVEQNGHRFSALVLAVVQSDPFQKRRANARRLAAAATRRGLRRVAAAANIELAPPPDAPQYEIIDSETTRLGGAVHNASLKLAIKCRQ